MQAESRHLARRSHVSAPLRYVRPRGEPPSDFYLVRAEEPEAAADAVLRLVREHIPRRFKLHPLDDVQVLSPMQRGSLGARSLNLALQRALNPAGPAVERYGWTFRLGDRVMQTSNDYEKDVFNGDIGRIAAIDTDEQELLVTFDGRDVAYDFNELDELVLSYATTVHKRQGSEYPAVVVPVHTQHFTLLRRNLLYTAMTRGKRRVVLVGTKKAIAMAVKRTELNRRIATLRERLVAGSVRAGRPGRVRDRPPRRLLATGVLPGWRCLMSLLGWLERKVFLGDVIKDYGVLDDTQHGIGRLRTSVLLCRRNGRLKLAFRTTGTSPLSANVSYAMIDVTPAALAKLAEVVRDAQDQVSATGPS